MKTTIQVSYDEKASLRLSRLIYKDKSGRFYQRYGDGWLYCGFSPETPQHATEANVVVVEKFV